MRSIYTDSLFRGKYLTDNGFSYINFLQDVKTLAVRRCFLPVLAIFHCA